MVQSRDWHELKVAPHVAKLQNSQAWTLEQCRISKAFLSERYEVHILDPWIYEVFASSLKCIILQAHTCQNQYKDVRNCKELKQERTSMRTMLMRTEGLW